MPYGIPIPYIPSVHTPSPCPNIYNYMNREQSPQEGPHFKVTPVSCIVSLKYSILIRWERGEGQTLDMIQCCFYWLHSLVIAQEFCAIKGGYTQYFHFSLHSIHDHRTTGSSLDLLSQVSRTFYLLPTN